ncbi:MAG: OsmC family protein [Deltaproteobacteria bacterium]|nr:OsmC family protein [Deltaproteobacteria bacterium]
MMGTLAAVLAGKEISTPKDRYRAHVKGDIEDVDGVLKITHIHVHYFLKVSDEQEKEAEEALNTYLSRCPSAQSVIGCIELTHEISFE